MFANEDDAPDQFDDDLGLLDAATACDPVDDLVNADDMAALELATAGTERQANVVYSTGEQVMFEVNGQIEIDEVGDVEEAAKATNTNVEDEAIIAARLEQVDLKDMASAVRSSVSIIEADHVGIQVKTVAHYVGQLAATTEEFLEFMSVMGDKRDVERDVTTINCCGLINCQKGVKIKAATWDSVDVPGMASSKTQSVSARKLFRARRSGEKTSVFAHPTKRWKVVQGIQNLKFLELARKCASRKEPKEPVEPTQPQNGDAAYGGANGWRKFDQDIVKYQKDKKEFVQAMARYKTVAGKRGKMLDKNKAIALKAIDKLGAHYPNRGRWFRLNLPVRNRIFHPKAQVCAIAAAAEAAAKERAALEDARKKREQHSAWCAALSAIPGNGLVNIGQTIKHQAALENEHALAGEGAAGTDLEDNLSKKDQLKRIEGKDKRNNVDAAARLVLLDAEKAKEEALAIGVAKRLAEEAKAKEPLWSEEEALANARGLQERAEKAERDKKNAQDATILARLDAEEKAENARLDKEKNTSVDMWLAAMDREISKVRQWTLRAKTRRVNKSRANKTKSHFFNIMNPGKNTTSDEKQAATFEDLEDTGEAPGVSSNEAAGPSKQ